MSKSENKNSSAVKVQADAGNSVLSIYCFGKPKQEVRFIDVDNVVVAATSKETAWQIYKRSRSFDDEAILKKEIRVNNIRNGSILIQ